MRLRKAPARILVVGGGSVGLWAALRLQRRFRRGEAEITVVDPQPYMTYAPFLPECAAGSLEPRHVVVPLRQVLRGCAVVTGRVVALRHEHRAALIEPLKGPAFVHRYDHVVMAVGSVSRTLTVPGLAEHAVGCKTIEEAVWLRNHVLGRLDVAEALPPGADRSRALTFVVVGGGFAGVEVVGELESLVRHAVRFYPNLDPDELRWVLIEASDRILPEVGPELGAYTVGQLRRRGISVLLERRVRTMVDGEVVLDDATTFAADTIVWTAGVRPHPVLARTDLARDDRGRLLCTPELRIPGAPGAWAAGDCAGVPDLSRPLDDTTCAPSAQHAVRQAKVVADNVVAAVRGRPSRTYRHRYAGAVASLGLHQGVAEIYGITLRGFVAWWLHRTYHVMKIPTLDRKVRIIVDWTMALFFRRELTALGRTASPRDAFRAAIADAERAAA